MHELLVPQPLGLSLESSHSAKLRLLAPRAQVSLWRLLLLHGTQAGGRTDKRALAGRPNGWRQRPFVAAKRGPSSPSGTAKCASIGRRKVMARPREQIEFSSMRLVHVAGRLLCLMVREKSSASFCRSPLNHLPALSLACKCFYLAEREKKTPNSCGNRESAPQIGGPAAQVRRRRRSAEVHK